VLGPGASGDDNAALRSRFTCFGFFASRFDRFCPLEHQRLLLRLSGLGMTWFGPAAVVKQIVNARIIEYSEKRTDMK
jgi:hypothetical protein